MTSTKFFVATLLAILSVDYVIGSEIGVPVLLWRRKTDPDLNSALEDRGSSVTQINAEVLADDYIGKTETVVAFIQSRLSLEQFTAEDEDRLTAVKKIFSDQSIKPTLLIDVLNPTEALTSKKFRTEQWDRVHVQNGDKVSIELPSDSLVDNNELLAQLMADIQKNVSKNTLFLITGHKNQFQSIDLAPERTVPRDRQKRAVEDQIQVREGEGLNETNLISFEDCIFLYTTSISVYNGSFGREELAKFTNLTHETTVTVDTNTSQCWEITNGTRQQLRPAILDLTFTNSNETKLDLHLVIDTPFFQNTSDFWRISNFTATLTFKDNQGGGEFDLSTGQVNSEENFAYSCGSLTILSQTNDTNDPQIYINFARFQLQPFTNPINKDGNKNKYVFTETYDCQTWFTLPLWMGLISLLVLFGILFMGIYFVSQINTPDRFENPKGKPLIITNFDE